MACLRLLPFFFGIVFLGSSPSAAEDTAGNGAVSGLVRVPRSHANKLCRKYGICNGGGFQGGYQGYQGNYGYQGYQQPYPPINIAISQSQSSANEAGGGYSNGYYPNNYQFNGGYPNQRYPNYQRPPGNFNNGQGSYNNQFNGNYYGPSLGQQGGGGYGFHGAFFDEASEDNEQKVNQVDGSGSGAGAGGYNDYNQGRSNEGSPQGNFAVAGSFAAAGRQN
ncbi:ATP-dependent RNA helicase A [Amyelois transitella]|uniref:ATP-dependent RNA helicase A n=1 Tax=Amyelois transitella TaxID=680683 RepID=UPI00067B6AFD|nr:ATP-dependent RNA helicase A [Amyelois transitella]